MDREEKWQDRGVRFCQWLMGTRRFGLRTCVYDDLVPEEKIRVTQETPEDIVERIKKLGINLIITHGFTGFGIESEKEDRDYVTQISRLCHKEGIKIGAYIQTNSLMYETFFKEFPEAKDWLQRDYYGNPILYTPNMYFRYLPCPNKEGFIDFLKKVIKDVLENLQSDLLHFDNSNLFRFNSCHCKTCLAKFRAFLRTRYNDTQTVYRRFGLSDFDEVSFPVPPVDFEHYNWVPGGLGAGILNDPILQEWVRFRCESVNSIYKQLVNYTHSISPNTACICNPALNRGDNIAVTDGVDFSSLLEICDGFWAENENYPGISKDNVLVSRIRDFKMGRIAGNKLVLTYGFREGIEHKKLFIAETFAFNQQSVGQYCWASDDFKNLSEEIKYVKFRNKYEDYYMNTVNIADVAVYHSYPSLTYNWNETYLPLILYEQVLIQGKVPFDILFKLDDLTRYKVIILCEAECMSQQEISRVLSFVENGGGLVLTGKTSFYDEFRRRRAKPGLCDLFEDFWPQHKVRVQHGKGRVIYLPKLSKGQASCTGMKAIGPNYWKLPNNWKELLNAVEWAADYNFSIGVQAPLSLCLEVLKQEEKGRVVTHFVNYDVNREIREVKVSLDGSLFPQGVKEIIALSPDWKGEKRNLRFKVQNKRVTFKLEGIRRYAVGLIFEKGGDL